MKNNRIIAVSGTHGFIGSHVVETLNRNHYTVWPMVRKKPKKNEIYYNYEKNEIDDEKLSKVHAVIHLAGKNILSGIWFEKTKTEIYDSRIKSSNLIAKTMAKLVDGPKILLNASAIGFYGDRENELLEEDSKPGHNYLANLCVDWEKATEVAKKAGIRVVNLRFGLVLSKDGGMLKSILPLYKMGLGAILGSGEQYVSYIALDDALKAIQFALKDSSLRGPVNVCTPNPITNKEFSKKLATSLRRPLLLKVPAKLYTLFAGRQGAIALDSVRAFPKALLDKDFAFDYESADEFFKTL